MISSYNFLSVNDVLQLYGSLKLGVPNGEANSGNGAIGLHVIGFLSYRISGDSGLSHVPHCCIHCSAAIQNILSEEA